MGDELGKLDRAVAAGVAVALAGLVNDALLGLLTERRRLEDGAAGNRRIDA